MEDNKIIQFNRNFKKKSKPLTSFKRGYSLYNEGMCFYRQEKDLMALDKFLLAEQEGYESADMYSYIAYIYYAEKEDNEKAKCYVEKAINTDKEYGYPYRLMALLCDDEQDYENALKYNLLAEKYEYDMNSPMMRHISELYTKIGSRNQLKALEYATKAIKLDSKNSYNWYFKGWVYYSNNDYENAIKFFKKAEDKGASDAEFYFEYSYACGELGEHEKAVEYANKYIFIDKESYLGYYRKGYAYFLAGQEKQAKEAFLQADKMGCEDVDMYTKLCFIFAQEDNLDKSLEYVNKAIKYEKRNPEGYYFKGHIYNYKLFDYKFAVKNYKKAYDLYLANGDCMNNEAYNHYVCALYMYGRYKRALKIVDEALEFYPDDKYLIESKISVLQFQKKYEEAEKLTQKLVEVDPDSCWTKYAQGVVFYNKNKRKDKNFEKVIEYIEPLDCEEINEFGGRDAVLSFCYYELKDYEKSLEYMYRFVKVQRLKEFMLKNGKELKRYYLKLLKKLPNDKRMDFISEKLSEYIN